MELAGFQSLLTSISSVTSGNDFSPSLPSAAFYTMGEIRPFAKFLGELN